MTKLNLLRTAGLSAALLVSALIVQANSADFSVRKSSPTANTAPQNNILVDWLKRLQPRPATVVTAPRG